VDPKTQNLTNAAHHTAQKEWRQPQLRKLPIAATAQSNKPGGNSNDGGSMGKGEVTTPVS
jgi:hypothetical protein